MMERGSFEQLVTASPEPFDGDYDKMVEMVVCVALVSRSCATLMVKSERLVKFSLYGLCLVLSFFFLVGCYAYDLCTGKCLRGLPCLPIFGVLPQS